MPCGASHDDGRLRMSRPGDDGCMTADVASARRGPCASPIGSESRTMRNDFVESAGSVEYSTGGNTECGRTSCGADDWDPHADDFLHVTTGKQARAAAMRAVRKVQSIPESDLADRCCLNGVCVCYGAPQKDT